ncbi:MAG: MBL fold metallo-hydrolase [Acidobacteria bacterium]|nr:MBL fold metallo-hydrolase [Acidobacteriota bacterium]
MRGLVCLLAACAVMSAPLNAAPKTLDFYFVDVEGGQATLIVTPAGESLLVDAGWPGFEGRDPMRIQAAMKQAGIQHIDYFWMTHYHTDHVGGLEALAEKVTIKNFVDHGDNNETNTGGQRLSASYERARAKGKRITLRVGDKLPLKGVEVVTVAANGELLVKAVKGGGAENAACAAAQKKGTDPTENARSLGFLMTFGKFRFLDLGDLTWNKELELVCPKNLLGKVDVYLTTHHGMDMSGPAQIVHALAPRVTIMNNGAKKGGSAPAVDVVRASPGLEDLWQVHFAVAGGADHNAAADQIANLEEKCEGHGLKVSAGKDGSFEVVNLRNQHKKTYSARR